MIRKLQLVSELACYDELKSVKLKLEKNERVSFIRSCWGWFVHFIYKVLFCFGNNVFLIIIIMDKKQKKTFVMTEKRKEAFLKMIENKKKHDKPIVKILCSKYDGKLTWEGINSSI